MADRLCRVTYTNAQGQRITERPCYMIAADGMTHSLWLADGPYVTLPIDSPVGELWAAVRTKIGGLRQSD
jgi:hypothetical protein